MTLADLNEGLLVDGSVRLVRLLGQGGMGSVWVADHVRLGTQVAVKFLSPALAREAEAIVRFQHEAMAAAHIKSPHVVQTFDHGVFAGERPYIVMELLEGENLGQRLERAGPLPLGELARLVGQICRALGKAHAVGIVHRDIKPENIFLVDQEGEPFVKVLDFGIAKSTNAALSMVSTKSGLVVGTPHYMSPEHMIDQKRLDFRADLWSLGVVAYRCLLGRVPFDGKTLGGLCLAIERGVFDLPSRERADVPTQVDAWFLKALSRDPKARFASAREMAETLLAACALSPSPSRDRFGSWPDGARDDSYAFTPTLPLAPSPLTRGNAWSPERLSVSLLPESSPQPRLDSASSVTPPAVANTVREARLLSASLARLRETQPPQRKISPELARSLDVPPPSAPSPAALSPAALPPSTRSLDALSLDAVAPGALPPDVLSLDAAPPNALSPDASLSEEASTFSNTLRSTRRSRRSSARWAAFGVGALVVAMGATALVTVSRETLERSATHAGQVNGSRDVAGAESPGSHAAVGVSNAVSNAVANAASNDVSTPSTPSAALSPRAVEVVPVTTEALKAPARGGERGAPASRRPGRLPRGATSSAESVLVVKATPFTETSPADGPSAPLGPPSEAPRASGPSAPPAPNAATPTPPVSEVEAAPAAPKGKPAAPPPAASAAPAE
ncbi:MAG: serine/threonine protein kinase [Polyangiaceae bacterium]|jgi:serine/threonine-protein kinase|nr:serine/threonine protein kinase [Polyangiaceae bacterium]